VHTHGSRQQKEDGQQEKARLTHPVKCDKLCSSHNVLYLIVNDYFEAIQGAHRPDELLYFSCLLSLVRKSCCKDKQIISIATLFTRKKHGLDEKKSSTRLSDTTALSGDALSVLQLQFLPK
jgi:hypothetical protein